MGIKLTNFASSTIANAGGIGAGDLSVDVSAGTGALFPSLSTGEFFFATMVDSSGNREIVKVTARATDTFTIVRAQEGTAARAFSLNDVIELRLTAETFDKVRNQQTAKTGNYSLTATDLLGNNTFTNAGAAGEVIFTLPAGVAGYSVRFIVSEAQDLTVQANGTDRFRFLSNDSAAGGYITAADVGTIFKIEYDDSLSDWVLVGLVGSVEPDDGGNFWFLGGYDLAVEDVTATAEEINAICDGTFSITEEAGAIGVVGTSYTAVDSLTVPGGASVGDIYLLAYFLRCDKTTADGTTTVLINNSGSGVLEFDGYSQLTDTRYAAAGTDFDFVGSAIVTVAVSGAPIIDLNIKSNPAGLSSVISRLNLLQIKVA